MQFIVHEIDLGDDIPPLTTDEMNLIYLFDTTSRRALITDLSESLPFMNDPDVLSLAQSAISRLEAMSDVDYDTLNFFMAEEYADEDISDSDMDAIFHAEAVEYDDETED